MAALLVLLNIAGLLLQLCCERKYFMRYRTIIAMPREAAVFGGLGSKLSNFLLFAHTPVLQTVRLTCLPGL